MLSDRAFPQVCYRTLVEYKGSGFLGIYVTCGGFFAFGTRFVGKSVAKLNYSLEKVFVCHKWYGSLTVRGEIFFENNWLTIW